MEAKYRQLFGPVLLVGSLGELENLSSRYERSLGSSIQWWVYTFPLTGLNPVLLGLKTWCLDSCQILVIYFALTLTVSSG